MRERAGLSQRELAESMGVSQPRIAAIERSHNITIEVLEALKARLVVSWRFLSKRGGRRTRLIGAVSSK